MKLFNEKSDSLKSVYKRTFRGGRRAFAFLADAVFMSLLIFAALYLAVRPRFQNRSIALFVTLISFTAVVLIYVIIRRDRFERHVKKLRKEAEKAVLDRKLLLRSDEVLSAAHAVGGAFVSDEIDALRADTVKRAINEYGENAVIVTFGKPTESAKTLLNGFRNVKVVSPYEYLGKEPGELVSVTEEETDRELYNTHASKKPGLGPAVFKLARDRAVKFLVLGAVLFALSFIVRYPIYYRIMGSAAISMGGYAFAADELKRHAKS